MAFTSEYFVEIMQNSKDQSHCTAEKFALNLFLYLHPSENY